MNGERGKEAGRKGKYTMYNQPWQLGKRRRRSVREGREKEREKGKERGHGE